MRIFILLLAFLFSFFLFPFFLFPREAEAKVLPQAKKSGIAVKASGGSGISVSPKLSRDRTALTVYFSSLQNAKYVSYLLTYSQNGQQEGAGGALNLGGGSSQTAELLFGTCSKNVCRYHTYISDARLEITYTNKSGKKYLKKYRLKI